MGTCVGISYEISTRSQILEKSVLPSYKELVTGNGKMTPRKSSHSYVTCYVGLNYFTDSTNISQYLVFVRYPKIYCRNVERIRHDVSRTSNNYLVIMYLLLHVLCTSYCNRI